jgi:hypothetical protein
MKELCAQLRLERLILLPVRNLYCGFFIDRRRRHFELL